MPSVKAVISKLPPYKDVQKLITRDQYVNDIVSAILTTDKQYRGHYDLIYKKFEGRDIDETAENIFEFLKRNTEYVIESDEKQYVKSPAAIIETVTNDCKNYALFIAGVLGAYSRNVEPVNYVFRFASYRLLSREPEHVFIVVDPGSENELWIDPVLPRLNDRSKRPIYITDYKPLDMALYKVAGIPAKNVAGIGRMPVFASTSNKRIAGGAFGIGEDKLRAQMNDLINQYALTFLYMYLPVGLPGQTDRTVELGIPAIVKDKANKAFVTIWDWGMPTGLRVEQDVFPVIRNQVTARLGMSPEEFWGRILTTPVQRGLAGPTYPAAPTSLPLNAKPLDLKPATGSTNITGTALNIISSVMPYVALVKSVLNSLVPNLSMTYDPVTFQFDANDWKGTKYEAAFTAQAVNPATGLPKTTTNAGMSILLFGAAVGVGWWMLKKKKGR